MLRRSNFTDLVRGIEFGTISAENASIAFVIPLQLVSMKNSKIQSVKNGRAYTFKNPAVVAFERDFQRLVPPDYKNRRMGSLTQPLRAIVTVYYPSRRQDLDCALVFDCLQAAGVIANDRYVIEQHLYAEVDAKNPRVEIALEYL